MNAEHFAYALRCLTVHDEPEGMHNPHDEQERERLAVACIRGAKDAEDMPSAYDAACERIRRKCYGIGGSHSVGLQLAAERLAGTADAQRQYAAPGIILKASKSVPGCSRPLRWVVGII